MDRLAIGCLPGRRCPARPGTRRRDKVLASRARKHSVGNLLGRVVLGSLELHDLGLVGVDVHRRPGIAYAGDGLVYRLAHSSPGEDAQWGLTGTSTRTRLGGPSPASRAPVT